MRCIAVINQKGGCGKTTVSINLSAALAVEGHNTLLVDMDPQSHCAVGLAVPEDQIERSIYDVLIARHSNSKLALKDVVWQIAQDFDLAPSGIELAALEQQLSGKDRREDCLKGVLADYGQGYDYVIVDCPPSIGLLTFNALRAADEVVIPVETGYFALHGLSRQLETLNVLKQQCNQDIMFRVIASMYDVRTKLAREVLSELKKNYKAELFETVVNFNTKLKEAASFGQPITEYDPASKGMRDFAALAQEITNSLAASEKAVHREQVVSVEDRLRAISKSADQLLSEAKEIGGEQPKVVKLENAQKDLQAKIDSFYGVQCNQGKVKFASLYPKAQTVQIAGDFNNWQPEQTQLSRISEQGRWETEMPLDCGTYRYRYVVDGQWHQDPYNEQTEVNPFGDLNSLLVVQ